MEKSLWDGWVEEALSKLQSLKLLRSLRPIYVSTNEQKLQLLGKEYEVFDEMQQWDRSSVEVSISQTTFHRWLHEIPSSGDEIAYRDGVVNDEAGMSSRQFKKLLLFSGNDYLGLSSHPTIGKAAAKAALEHGMGPRGSALICGYTNYHRLLESCLADLKKKEDCLLCPTGFAANMAVMVALGNIASLLPAGEKPLKDEIVAIFSDAYNHASIIDGIRLAERTKNVEVFVYRHCDMSHLNSLLSSCTMKKKVVVTDSLFSMDGDFAPMIELAKLRKKYGFLLVLDDAHGTFAAGCNGGFIACSERWKQFIQSRGRSFIFSTATTIPIAAAAHAAVIVAKKETWRRTAIWNRVRDFQALTGIPISSPIISVVVGSEEKALQASRHLLKSGFHVTAIRPPTVPSNSCRLRITLSAAHTTDDLKKLTTALSGCINFGEIGNVSSNVYAKL
ncbi:hypothetical protein LWI28_021753 [Acer negundo]|uniref:Aminotransferase class I/classII large domain-containing protein n=1 Tax=Acer negundo TaxID=4023 RepID=A0AAD5IFG7_ACENE|nr:hypothetical protein LWI28_021753 [Acer negundo]